MEEITLQALLEAGCHFGHKAERWHPKAAQFIYTKKDGIHIIDLAKKELKLATEIGLPENKDLEIIHPDLENQLNEPEFAAAVGLLYLGTDQHLKDGQWLPVDKFSIDSIKRILKYFAP